MNNRIKSFIWRAGVYVVVALAGYLSNIGNIQEVDLNKLLTMFVVTLSVFVVNEATKHMNSGLSTVPATKKVAVKKKTVIK